MSTPHHFVNMNVEYDGDRHGVDLEGSDGVHGIDCLPDHWRIQTKDLDHYNVAKTWPKDVILVSSTFCQSGASRRLLEVEELSYVEPNTIIAHGKEGLLGNGPPVSKININMGKFKPNSSKRGLDNPTPVPRGYRMEPKWKGNANDIQKRSSNNLNNRNFIKGIIGSITSEVGNFNPTYSTQVSGSVHIPTATPTAISPWDTPGTKLASVENMDVWDLGLQMASEITIGGGFSIDNKNIGKADWFTGSIDLDGLNWNLDFPIGFDFKGSDFQYSWTNWQIIPPVDLCPELGCFAVENVFKLGSFVQAALNITVDVKKSGRINMGTNLTYTNPKAHWDITDHTKNSASGWDGTQEKWFNVSDGTAELTGSVGLDLTQFNGFVLQLIKDASANVSLTDGVSIAAHVSQGYVGSSRPKPKAKYRRDLSPGQPSDILARELLKRDTCTDNGGTNIELDLEEQVILQAGIGPFGTAPALWATQVPLYTTCIS